MNDDCSGGPDGCLDGMHGLSEKMLVCYMPTYDELASLLLAKSFVCLAKTSSARPALRKSFSGTALTA